MATKRKFKRDYIILEAKDMNFRYKERVLPKAFAKVEINEEKAVVALYVENLKCVKDGYKVVAIQSDYETLDLGNVVLSEQGKGEFVFDLERNDIEIKGIALLHEKQVPLIGFKGNKIENYEEILFAGQDEYEEEFDDELDDLEDTEDIYLSLIHISETIFYTMAIYYGSLKIKNTRHTLTCAMISHIVGVIASVFICYIMFV